MSFGRQKTYFKIDCRIYGMKMSVKARLTGCIVCLLHMLSFTGTPAARVGRRNVPKTQTQSADLDAHSHAPARTDEQANEFTHTHTHCTHTHTHTHTNTNTHTYTHTYTIWGRWKTHPCIHPCFQDPYFHPPSTSSLNLKYFI